MEKRNNWVVEEDGSHVSYSGFGDNVTAFFGTRAMDDELLFERLGIDTALFANQVHSPGIMVVGKDLPATHWIEEGKKGYDGIVVNRPGWAAAVYTADCVPVLLHDGRRKVWAAVHAGWRGTAKEIVKRAVEAMVHSFGSRPKDIMAAIGPSIGHCCYQVDDVVCHSFSPYPWKREIFREDGDRWRLDLREANRRQLIDAGLSGESIGVSHLCTACRTDMFFSYRMEKPTGRMVSGIICRR